MQTSIERISHIKRTPIQGVNLDVAYVKGYQCVVPTKTYHTGETVVLIRPETFLTGRFHPYLENKVRQRVRIFNGRVGIVIKQCSIRCLRSEAVIIKYHGNGQVGTSMDKKFHAEKYCPLVNTIESFPLHPYSDTFKCKSLSEKYNQLKEIIFGVRYFESLEEIDRVFPKREGYTRVVKYNLGGHFCVFFKTDTDTYVVNKFGIGIRVSALSKNNIYRIMCESDFIFHSHELLIGTIIGTRIRHASYETNDVKFITYASIKEGVLTDYRPSMTPVKEIKKKFIAFYIMGASEVSYA